MQPETKLKQWLWHRSGLPRYIKVVIPNVWIYKDIIGLDRFLVKNKCPFLSISLGKVLIKTNMKLFVESVLIHIFFYYHYIQLINLLSANENTILEAEVRTLQRKLARRDNEILKQERELHKLRVHYRIFLQNFLTFRPTLVTTLYYS